MAAPRQVAVAFVELTPTLRGALLVLQGVIPVVFWVGILVAVLTQRVRASACAALRGCHGTRSSY